MTRIRPGCLRSAVCAVAAASLLGAAPVVSPAAAVGGFNDVPEGHYYSEAVQWAVDSGLVTSEGSGGFRPQHPALRSDAALWMWRMEGSPTADQHTFTDVPAEADVAVAWMVDARVTTGTSATTFSPLGGLTRGQFAAFLWRLDGRPEAEPHAFTDVTSDWQQQPVSWLAASGITTGTSTTTFSPDIALTRAQLVTFLWRYDQLQPDPDDQPLDGLNTTTGDETAEPTTITVPPEAPSGRCTSEISNGIYRWERCAWLSYVEDGDHHRALSDGEAETLIARIWREVDVDGKRAAPPTASLVPAGTECASTNESGFVIGCYQPDTHHIRRLDSFNDTLLHEVAHALVSGHPTVTSCVNAASNDDYQACVHNDIFRCAADHLYVRYAGIPSAGVCGTAPAPSPPAAPDGSYTGSTSQTQQWRTGSFSDTGSPFAAVQADLHTRVWPYDTTSPTLVVTCDPTIGLLEVYIDVDSGYLAGQYRLGGRIPVNHAFLPEAWWSWERQQLQDYLAANRRSSNWHEDSTNTAAFLPEADHEEFINGAVSSDWLLVTIYNYDNSAFGTFAFGLGGAYAHIRPITEQCGWTWT